jgi:PAS domain S-box-containing protein
MTNEREPKANLAPKFPLSLLLVEDNPADAELCLEFLSNAQFDVQSDVVTTAEQVIAQLRTTNYDVVLADYNLGSWTGMDVLNLLTKENCDVPFILITAALGDQTAVECLKHGVSDYVLKDRMDRLPVAIYRALEQRAARKERERSKRSLMASERKFRTLADAIPTAVFLEQGTRCIYANRAAAILTGYSREELLAKSFSQMMPEDLRKGLAERFNGGLDADTPAASYETRILTKEGEPRWLNVTVGVFQIDGRLAALISAVDVTGQRGAEKKVLTEDDFASERLRRVPPRDIHFIHLVQANTL